VTDAEKSSHETDTEVIPPVSSGKGLAQTRELPVVEDEPVSEPVRQGVREPVSETIRKPLPAPTPQPAPERRPVVSPSQATPDAVAASHASTVLLPAATPTSGPASARTAPGEGTRWRSAFWALVALLVIAVVAGVAVRGRSPSTAAGSTSNGTGTTISATVSSLDPSGGSGFQSEGGTTWRTQTYQSAAFGNLKSGVGLLLDVGAPRAVVAVTFEVVGGPVAVELRAGDERASSEGGYARISGTGDASGPTTLTAKDGAKHRYWLIWVTRLAAQDGGYRAVIGHPVVKGPAS
jgi:hypothetical protein